MAMAQNNLRQLYFDVRRVAVCITPNLACLFFVFHTRSTCNREPCIYKGGGPWSQEFILPGPGSCLAFFWRIGHHSDRLLTLIGFCLLTRTVLTLSRFPRPEKTKKDICRCGRDSNPRASVNWDVEVTRVSPGAQWLIIGTYYIL